jgi:cell division protein FtsW
MQNSLYYIERQIIFAGIGVVAMLAISTVPPERLKGKFTWSLLGVSYVLLVVVLFMRRVQGVRRWISLGFISFQPSEIAKFAAILWCASYITAHYKDMNVVGYPDQATKLRANRSKFAKWRYTMWQNFKVAVLPFLVVLGPMLGLIVIEPHLSCTILVVLIIGTQMFVGGTKKSYFGALGILAVVAGYLVIYTDIVPYGKTRINVWLDPFVDKLGDGWQNIQSLYAISSGGLFGVGLGNSRQKYLYISEPQNDFIFAVICEELGLIGAMFVILLFVLFVWRGFAVSLANPDRFSKFVGIGITSQIGFQALLNVCVVTKIVPNTGISLPFFSSGGTSLTMLLMEIGVLLAISRRSPNKII